MPAHVGLAGQPDRCRSGGQNKPPTVISKA